MKKFSLLLKSKIFNKICAVVFGFVGFSMITVAIASFAAGIMREHGAIIDIITHIIAFGGGVMYLWWCMCVFYEINKSEYYK